MNHDPKLPLINNSYSSNKEKINFLKSYTKSTIDNCGKSIIDNNNEKNNINNYQFSDYQSWEKLRWKKHESDLKLQLEKYKKCNLIMSIFLIMSLILTLIIFIIYQLT
jgi:hypothetical protein